MRAPSIRRSLLIRCGLGVGVLLCLLSCAAYLLVKRGLYQELDESIEQTAALLANQVELENEAITYEWKEGLGTNPSLPADALFQYWDVTAGHTERSPALHIHDLPKFTGPDGQPRLKNIHLPGGRRGRAIGLLIHPFVLPEEIKRMMESGHFIDPKTKPQILVVARDAEAVRRTLYYLRWGLALGTLLTLGLVFAMIHRVVKITLRPIDELALQMQERAEHQLDSALAIPGKLPTELAGLAENIDTLLARVAAIRLRERDFIRHAAHELRTPIAGLRATTDLALSQPRDAAGYATRLATCQKTAIELGELVKRLSALARIGQAASPAAREPIDLVTLLAGCMETFLPLFEERGLRMTRDLPATGLSVTGDPTLARIIFNNLLDNATSYAPAGSEIRITATTVNGQVEIRFANQTDDLPENVERLFEPLFRQESSRYHAGSHLGIGLTLSLEAATSMGATLTARKPDAGWIEFTLGMPSSTTMV